MKQDEGIIHVDNCRSLYPQPYPSFSPSSVLHSTPVTDRLLTSFCRSSLCPPQYPSQCILEERNGLPVCFRE